METVSNSLLVGITLWLGLCATCAVYVIRQHRQFPLLREQGLALIGLGLLAIAPCTFLLLHWLDDDPSVFGSGLQLGGAVLMFLAAWHARRVRLDPANAASAWTFREKSASVVLLALCVLAFSYFGRVGNVPPEAAFAVFIDAIILLIILMIVGHIVIALLHGPTDELEAPRDERDRAVDLYSMRNAYYLLTGGFFAMPVIIIAQLPLAKALNIWFAVLVLSEIVYYGSLIAYYRFGTD